MRKKLKAYDYLKNNKKRVAILVVSFAIFITLIYGLRFFINPMKYTHENVVLGKSKYLQGVYVKRGDIMNLDKSLWEEKSTATDEEKIAELNRATREFGNQLDLNDEIDYVIPCSTYTVNIHTLISDINYQIPLVEEEQAKTICNYLKVTLQEGHMPKEPSEVIIDERMAANLKLKLGDSINKDNTKICGIVKSDYYFAVGIHFDDRFIKRSLLFLDKGYITDMQEYFKNLGFSASYSMDDDISILWDMEGGKKEVTKSFSDMNPVLRITVLITTLILAGTLLIVYQLHVQDRYEEWCLYRSLGFGQTEIYWLAVKDIIISMGMAILLAVILCILVILVGGAFMDARGIVYRIWMPEVFCQILGVLVFLAGILHLPVLVAMKRIRTIDVIDDDI